MTILPIAAEMYNTFIDNKDGYCFVAFSWTFLILFVIILYSFEAVIANAITSFKWRKI